MGLGYVWDQTTTEEIMNPEGGSSWGVLINLGLDWRI